MFYEKPVTPDKPQIFLHKKEGFFSPGKRAINPFY